MGRRKPCRGVAAQEEALRQERVRCPRTGGGAVWLEWSELMVDGKTQIEAGDRAGLLWSWVLSRLQDDRGGFERGT